jgi:hypothetical protein
MVINIGLSTSAHIGRMACVCALPRWRVRGWKRIPPPTPSTVMPRYDTPVSHVYPSVKSWVNKQALLADHAFCHSGQYFACILHIMQVTYRSILNFYDCQRGARRPLLKSGKKPPARGLPAAHLRPHNAALEGLFLSSYIQFNTATP